MARIEQPGGAGRSPCSFQAMSIALFLLGFGTFSLIYCVQPVLPELARDFHVTAVDSSLALSLTTECLAIAILLSELVCEMVGRRAVMFVSLCGASVLNIVDAALPSWHALLWARAFEGLLLGGVPAAAIAYVAEEVQASRLGLSMGLYIGGTAFGGMMGRVGMGLLTQVAGWRSGVAALGAIDLTAACVFVVLLPPSCHFQPSRRVQMRYHWSAWAAHLRDRALRALFLVGLLVNGAFIAVYNYAAFRLTASPYRLTTTEVSLIFFIYLLGMLASAAAGAFTDRIGRAPVLTVGLGVAMAGALITLLKPLVLIIAGVAVLTVGFFMSHATASAWVGNRATGAKGHAASLYLLSYYTGSSSIGWVTGWFWLTGGWNAVTGFVAGLLGIALVAALWLRQRGY